MPLIETEYANTDFDLKSETSFDTLHRELSTRCCVLHYTRGDDGHFHSSYESDRDGESEKMNAEGDIRSIIDAISRLSEAAKAEFDACYLREFNIGFHCGDSWAFGERLRHDAIGAISDAGCSLAITLYPIRHPDGTPRE